MKLLAIILAIVWLLAPVRGEAAMMEMPDDTLKQVEGDPVVNFRQNRLLDVDTPASTDYPPTAGGYVLPANEFYLFHNEIQMLRQSREYETFLLLVDRLEDVAAGKDYPENMDSKGFLALCSRVAAASRHCSDKLALLESAVTSEQIKSLVQDQRKLLEAPADFYHQLSDYRREKSEAPDLKQLLTDMRIRQDAFETEYDRLKNLN